MLVIAAGLYRETRIQSTIQAAILVVGGIIFGAKNGLTGIMFASCLSNLYRCIDLYFFIPKMVTQMERKATLKNYYYYNFNDYCILFYGTTNNKILSGKPYYMGCLCGLC